MDQYDIKEIKRRLNSYTAYTQKNKIEELYQECRRLFKIYKFEKWIDEYSIHTLDAQIEFHRMREKLDIALRKYIEYIVY